MRISQWLPLLVLGLIGTNVFGVIAQEHPPSTQDIPSSCHAIPATKYQHIESYWNWHDADSLVFSVSPGNLKDFFAPNPLVWYQYHLSTDQLEELMSDPYQDILSISPALTKINDVQADTEGSYRNIETSPTGDRFIYPRISHNGGSYWYIDTKTGFQMDLDIPARVGDAQADVSLRTFWSANARRLIVQGQGWANFYVPTKIVTVEAQKATIQMLTDLSPFSTYAKEFRTSNFRVMGMSTDGQYIVIQPETMDNISWLYNLNTQQLSTINFSVLGEEIIWLNSTTFVARTNLGAVEYDVQSQKTQTLIASKLLPYNWSPDGRFLIGIIADQYGTIVNSNIWVCQIL